MIWRRARRKPLIFCFREPNGVSEVIVTETGVRIRVNRPPKEESP